jgi:rod shape-determining protein MreB and related proteins
MLPCHPLAGRPQAAVRQMRVSDIFSDDIAIDLGTANTLVHAVGRGIIIDEPSAVAVRSRGLSREIMAVGHNAKTLAAREPANIELIRPLRDGVVADFIATEEMLRQFIRRSKSMLGFRRPRILICVPAGATPVERRTVEEAARGVGARQVYIVEEPVAAALGAGLSLDDARGSMVVDIGGGTTDIAVLSEGTVTEARSLRCAGNAMDEAIIRYVRRQHQLLIGEVNAERIKIEAGTALATANGRAAEVHIRGRDVRQGSAKSAVLRAKDISEALTEPVDAIADFAQRALEDLPPDILSDIARRGVHLTGGGALLDKLDLALTRRVGVKFHVQQNPMHCVVKGSAAVLAGLDEHEHLLMRP